MKFEVRIVDNNNTESPVIKVFLDAHELTNLEKNGFYYLTLADGSKRKIMKDNMFIGFSNMEQIREFDRINKEINKD